MSISKTSRNDKIQAAAPRKQRERRKDVDPGDLPADEPREDQLTAYILFKDDYDRLLTFSVPIAEMIGLNESIALQSVHSWCTTNQNHRKRHMKRGIRNYFDGHYWTFQTWKQWRQGSFPFWSDKTVRRTFESLEEQNLIVVVKHDNDKRGQYFRVNYDEVNKLVQQINRKNPDKPMSIWHRNYVNP